MNSATHNPRLFGLIPCAGHGSRAGTAVPKQYETVAGQPMVMHTLAAFAAVKRLALVLVAVAPGDSRMDGTPGVTVAACGGPTRAATVGNGLRELVERGAREDDWVLVHDAARCLVTAAMIDRLIDACAADATGGLLALQLTDTLKQEEAGRVVATVPRDFKWLAQTPQMFRIGMLAHALTAAGDAVTDESGAIQALGRKPLLVPGSAQNFKVTYPDDFALAEAVLRSRQT